MNQTTDNSKCSPQSLSFTTFVLSLSTAALQHLGVCLAENEKSEPCTNLTLAKQTIDVLEMLEQKTQGNLTEEESKLLGNLLYDLRMRYVEVSKKTCD